MTRWRQARAFCFHRLRALGTLSSVMSSLTTLRERIFVPLLNRYLLEPEFTKSETRALQ